VIEATGNAVMERRNDAAAGDTALPSGKPAVFHFTSPSHAADRGSELAADMIRLGTIIRADVAMALAMLGALATCVGIWHFPVLLPASDSAAFVGLHYLYPLFGVAILSSGVAMAGKQAHRRQTLQILCAILCYAMVLYAHFSFKLWTPHINPTNYDQALWRVDESLHGVVQTCMAIRAALTAIIPYTFNAYMLAFIGLFYVGLIWQARVAPEKARELILACMIMQMLGTAGYLLMPAVGPFRYEVGVNPMVTVQQMAMLDFYRQSIAGGPDWLAAHGAHAFTAGLAAMPSLHVAGATLFFLNAQRHSRPLAIGFGVVLAYIVVTAVAARWHYLVDLPVGAGVAWFSLRAAQWLVHMESLEIRLPAAARWDWLRAATAN